MQPGVLIVKQTGAYVCLVIPFSHVYTIGCMELSVFKRLQTRGGFGKKRIHPIGKMLPPSLLSSYLSIACRLIAVGLLVIEPLVPMRADEATAAAEEVEEIQLPFGLEWGMTATRISEMLKASAARIKDRRSRGDVEIWTITGLQRTGLRHALFSLRKDELIEVELQYEYPDWDGKKYRTFFEQVRGNVEQRHGKGTIIVNTSSPHRDVLQTVMGYQWNQPETSVRLFFYEALRDEDAYHSVSLHYIKR